MSKTKSVKSGIPTQVERLNQSAPTLSTPGIASTLNRNGWSFKAQRINMGLVNLAEFRQVRG